MWVLLVLLVVLAGCNRGDFPSGETILQAPLVYDGASDLTLRGSKTTLRVAFDGPAAIIIRNSRNIRLEGITIVGNRDDKRHRFGLPPSNESMAKWTKGNGVLVESSEGVDIRNVRVREVQGYGILVSRSKRTRIEEVLITDSGSLDEKGRNNGTGGILLEEGSADFLVAKCRIRNVRGNGIWTHSLYTSPRNGPGQFFANDIRHVGRDALQAGHATQLDIRANTGALIGYPAEIVDVERQAIPVVLDTAGNVDKSTYRENQFEEINGKCIDLDGFHHGTVSSNLCLNRRGNDSYPHGHFGIVFNNSNPDMQSRDVKVVSNTINGFRYGGAFIIGAGHELRDNRFLRVNMMKCVTYQTVGCYYRPEEPDLLRSGVYLGAGADRPDPAANIVIENNVVEGFGISDHCVAAAPGVNIKASRVNGNTCRSVMP